jgi:hypothetical protein
MIMKKDYKKPLIEVVDMLPTEFLQASNFTPKPGDEYEEDEAGSKDREDEIIEEGVWGNLW